jgi:hypothetical protein
LASRRIPPVLDLAIPPAASGAAEHSGEDPRAIRFVLTVSWNIRNTEHMFKGD